MSTPVSKIYSVFYSQFQTSIELPEGIEEQFLLNALGDFEIELYSLSYNDDLGIVENSLTRSEINIIGKIMYKYYLKRERDKVLKINNIVGKDVRMTGLGETKREMNKAYDQLNIEIEAMLNKLKRNTYLW